VNHEANDSNETKFFDFDEHDEKLIEKQNEFRKWNMDFLEKITEPNYQPTSYVVNTEKNSEDLLKPLMERELEPAIKDATKRLIDTD